MTKQELKAEYDKFYCLGLLYLVEGDNAKAISYLREAACTMTDIIAISSGEIRETRKDYLVELIGKLRDIEDRIENQQIKDRVKGRIEKKMELRDEQFIKAEDPKISFDEVIGLEEVKRAVFSKIINPLKYSNLYKTFRKKTGGGILLYGAAGTGKTMIAKAIAHETQAAFYSVRISDLLSKWFSESESKIRTLFEEARKNPRSVIFIDEVEALIPDREADPNGSNAMSRVISEMLSQMEDFDKKNGDNLTVIAATNKPWAIDYAFLRPGRFDEKIYIPVPDEESREHLLRKRMEGLPVGSLDYDELVRRTERFSGADLDYLCEKAKESIIEDMIAGVPRKNGIEMLDFDRAFNSVSSSISLSEEQRLMDWGVGLRA